MATRTSTLVANLGVRAIHAGLQTAEASFNSGASQSAGDVIQMVPIPHGAVIVDCMVTGQSLGGDFYIIDVGTGADPDVLMDDSSLTISSVLRMSQKLGHGFRVSISDDAVPHFETVDITIVSGSMTGTASFKLSVTYYMAPA